MLAKQTPHQVTRECVRCDGDLLPLERPCLLCDGVGAVTVTVLSDTDSPDVLNDLAVDAQFDLEVTKGLRFECSQETADYMNAQVRSAKLSICAQCFMPCGGSLSRRLAPGTARCAACVAGACEVCGADDASKCSCPQCGEHVCECPDDAFERDANEQLARMR